MPRSAGWEWRGRQGHLWIDILARLDHNLHIPLKKNALACTMLSLPQPGPARGFFQLKAEFPATVASLEGGGGHQMLSAYSSFHGFMMVVDAKQLIFALKCARLPLVKKQNKRKRAAVGCYSEECCCGRRCDECRIGIKPSSRASWPRLRGHSRAARCRAGLKCGSGSTPAPI